MNRPGPRSAVTITPRRCAAALAVLSMLGGGLVVTGVTSAGTAPAQSSGADPAHARDGNTTSSPVGDGRRGQAVVVRSRRNSRGCPSAPPAQRLMVGHRTYALEGMDTFTKMARLGSFAQRSANATVYTGDHGMRWTGYPDGWPSTYSGHAEGYQPSTVLSVHNGMLDFHLHNDAQGNPVGADPSPLPRGHRYQTYGAWSLCERVAPADIHNLADFHQAFLLWPADFADWERAESDYPEQNLNTFDFAGYSHYGGAGAQDIFDIKAMSPSFDARRWHVYTQAWGPGFRSYFVDGRLVGTTRRQVWSGAERWQLQIEPLGSMGPVPNDGDSGHVYVRWVWIGTGPLRR